MFQQEVCASLLRVVQYGFNMGGCFRSKRGPEVAIGSYLGCRDLGLVLSGCGQLTSLAPVGVTLMDCDLQEAQACSTLNTPAICAYNLSTILATQSGVGTGKAL